MTAAAALLIEGPKSYHLATPCALVGEENDKATAWAGAQAHIEIRPDTAWLIGNFVEADNPNQNGHLFGLEDLPTAHPTVRHRPLNMAHHDRHNVGAFVTTELVFPVAAAEVASGTPVAAANYGHPIVEALAAMWKNIYPVEYLAVLEAHRMGASYFSMEAIPEAMTCLESDGGVECGQTFPFDGLYSDTYCAHMDDGRSKKRLVKPRFIGGAVIIPPVRPGWRHAEMGVAASDELVRRHPDEAEAIYAHMAQTSGHLSDALLQQMMVELLATSFGPSAGA